VSPAMNPVTIAPTSSAHAIRFSGALIDTPPAVETVDIRGTSPHDGDARTSGNA
jgi:hypothetical protein